MNCITSQVVLEIRKSGVSSRLKNKLEKKHILDMDEVVSVIQGLAGVVKDQHIASKGLYSKTQQQNQDLSVAVQELGAGWGEIYFNVMKWGLVETMLFDYGDRGQN